MSSLSQLPAAAIAALSAAINAKAAQSAKAALANGSTVSVDFTVRVQGTLAKASEGITVADSTALPWSSVLALAMHRSGMHADSLRALCVDVLKGNLTDAEKAAIVKGDQNWDDVVKPMLPTRTNAPAVKAVIMVTPVEG